ncbi:putative MFS-type transporter [Lachnellula willkommii]|uniref:Putative MFS-type transporter n=1 Tax=Lachnellula willkommii TaxID=215461 RepID=A0A559MJ98_9HELO|nr:putative MFS-type transporter [Lachnellula willkommii]
MSASITPPLASNGSTGDEQQEVKQMEKIAIHDQVPGHDNYYEKNGLRTYGDGENHDHEPPMSSKRFMSLAAMAFLWTGSQLPMYLYGGVPPYIYGDIGGVDRWIWMTLANLIASAAVCPFVGSLSDLLGRRYVALMGAGFIILGMIVCSTAKVMNVFIGGMTLSGIGAGMAERYHSTCRNIRVGPHSKTRKIQCWSYPHHPTLVPKRSLEPVDCNPRRMALVWTAWWAVVSQIMPVDCEVWHVSRARLSVPSKNTIGVYTNSLDRMFFGFLVILFFYFPPPRINSTGLTRKQLVAQIDFVGGFLSVSGMIIFLAGLQWGGYQSVISHQTHARGCLLEVDVYGHDPVQVGLRGLPVAFCVMVGAVINLSCLSIFKGRNKELLIISCVLMTAGVGALSCADHFNMYRLWGILVLAGKLSKSALEWCFPTSDISEGPISVSSNYTDHFPSLKVYSPGQY